MISIDLHEQELDSDKNIEMVASTYARNVYIMAFKKNAHQCLVHYKFNGTKRTITLQKNYSLKDELSKGQDIQFSHLTTNRNGDVAFVGNDTTLYKMPSDNELYFSRANIIQDAHTKPIISLYMDNNFVVSGSNDATIKMWDVNEKTSFFEQLDAYLLHYQGGQLLYGNWHSSEHTLEIAQQGPFEPSFDDKFYQKNKIVTYEGVKIDETMQPLIQQVTLSSDGSIQPPICTYATFDFGKSGYFAIYNQAKKAVTCYAYNTPENTTEGSFNVGSTFNDIKNLKGLYIFKDEDREGKRLIFVTNKEVRYTNYDPKTFLDPFSTVNTLSYNNLPAITFDNSAIIKASAFTNRMLFLIIADNAGLKLHTIDFYEKIRY